MPHFFGGCPECNGWSREILAGSNLWIVCDEHLTKWCVNVEMLREGPEMTLEQALAAEASISMHHEVTPR